jgi:hypothetical protein
MEMAVARGAGFLINQRCPTIDPAAARAEARMILRFGLKPMDSL